MIVYADPCRGQLFINTGGREKMLKTLFVIGLCVYGAIVTIYALRSDQPTRYKGKHRRAKK